VIIADNQQPCKHPLQYFVIFGGNTMLCQLHHQLRKNLNKHEMVAQADINSIEEKIEFIEDVKESHPLPSNEYQWLFCNEESEHFTWAVKEK